ncbi:MAG: HDOD domain-containing protein [Candidatus Muirbacterium halophilum]|nr:HDOD domain-containing protein [Candidatus Muirbacterium halophilum]MCK9475048.1 HDOD domain-containing protein [Candidatus Muirbacterium halophilum]
MNIFHFEDLIVLSKEELLSVLDKIDDIPTLPIVAAKLLKTVNNPNFSVKELAETVNMDQAITTKLLRVANSAFYAGNSETTSIDNAIMRLGVNQVRSIIIGVSVIKSFDSFSQFEFSIENFWKHSLAVAFLNKIVAEILQVDVSEDIWVSGIMHDIGKLIYAVYMPTLMTRLLSEVEREKISFFEAENKLLKFNHAEVGRWLCEKWSIPKKIKLVVASHHNPPINEFIMGKTTYLVGISHISDNIIKLSKIGNSGDFNSKLDSNIWNYFDKNKFDTKKLLSRVKGMREEVEDIFKTLKS